MFDFPQIVVGTYEEFVLGFKPQNDGEAKNKYKFFQTFATHSHQASVRCAAANEKLMASSGADEYINIYDMIRMKISRVINFHDSTVTCLEFTPDNSHLITANQNGDIAIFRCRDWNLVKLWKGAHKHANGVTSMSIHPTGSLLLTTGADNILRFWNLIKGRLAYATNFSKTAVGSSLTFGLWSPSGKYYVVCIGTKLEVYNTNKAAVIYKVEANSKISCAAFSKKNLLCIGTEEGLLEIHSLFHKKLIKSMNAHKSRLKCMSSFSKGKINDKEKKIENFIVTADSKGVIKLWSLKKKGENILLKQKCMVECDCRITCLTTVSLKSVKEETDESINETENQVAKISEINGAYLNIDSSEISKNKFGKNTVKKKKEKEKIVQNDDFSSGLKAGNSSQSKTIANQNGNEEIIKSSDSKKKIIYQSEKKRTLKNNSKGLKQQKKIKLSNSFNSDSI